MGLVSGLLAAGFVASTYLRQGPPPALSFIDSLSKGWIPLFNMHMLWRDYIILRIDLKKQKVNFILCSRARGKCTQTKASFLKVNWDMTVIEKDHMFLDHGWGACNLIENHFVSYVGHSSNQVRSSSTSRLMIVVLEPLYRFTGLKTGSTINLAHPHDAKEIYLSQLLAEKFQSHVPCCYKYQTRIGPFLYESHRKHFPIIWTKRPTTENITQGPESAILVVLNITWDKTLRTVQMCVNTMMAYDDAAARDTSTAKLNVSWCYVPSMVAKL